MQQKTSIHVPMTVTQCKLIWNPLYRVELLPNQTLFFFSENSKKLLKGELICKLAPLLASGSWDADEIVDKLGGQYPVEEIYYTLIELEKSGLIVTRFPSLPSSLSTLCNLFNVSELEAYQRWKSTKVYVHGNVELWNCLSFAQLQRAHTPDEAHLHVVAVSDYQHFGLAGIPKGHPFLLCKPFGGEIWVGPLFQPGTPGCVQCLASRIGFNRQEERFVQETLGLLSFSVPLPFIECAERMAWEAVALEVLKYILIGKNVCLEGKIQTYNIASGKREEHRFLPLPNCSCAEKRELRPAKIALQKVKKNETETGYRIVSTKETFEKFSPLVSSICGIVSYLVPAPTSKYSNLHVYYSGANVALQERHKGQQRYTLRDHSAGKGTSESAAQAGALCEALERFSGIFQGNEECKEATYRELGEEALFPPSVLLFSEKQIKNREKLNQNAHSFWLIYPPFPEDEKLSWTPLYSLTHQKVKYFPTACCYYRVSGDKNTWGIRGDSNGCAAGNCIEEAILQGFFELVERDSVAIWWYNRLVCPRVNIASFQHPYLDALLESYRQSGRKVWVLDLTMDLKIPTFVALSCQSMGRAVCFGFGTHLDSTIALVRALTEMNQLIPSEDLLQKSYFGDGPDDRVNREIMREWMETIKAEEHPYLVGNEDHVKKREDYPLWESADLLSDIDHCRFVVEQQGMEMLVLDQTRPEIGLAVVRVVVPGLRHFWPRFAPGRLYDVPVKLGLTKTSLKEEELNPFSLFI